MRPLRSFLRSPRIGAKLNVVVVLAFSLLLAAVMIIMSQSMQRLTLKIGQQRVGQEAEVIRRRFDEAERMLLADTKALVNAPGLTEAVAHRDTDNVWKAFSIWRASLNLDDIGVVDADGGRLAAVIKGAETNDAEQEDALLSLALLGIEATGAVVEEESELRFKLAAAVPLRDVSGQIVGGLIASREVDDEFLTEINLSRENPHLALVVAGKVAAQDFPHAEELEHFEAALSDGTAIEQVLSGQTVIAEDLILAQGIPYAMAYTPLAVGGDTRATISILAGIGELAVFQEQLMTNTVLTFVLLTLVAVAVVALFAWRGISTPMHRLTDVAQIVTQGNLDVEAEVKSKDEIGVLARALNHMIARLREMLRGEQEQREHLQQVNQELERRAAVEQEQREHLQRILLRVHEAADNLSSAVAEILAATTQQASGAGEQSAAISQTTTTVDEVKTIAEQSVARAQEVAGAAQRTVEVSLVGQEVVDKAIGSMSTIRIQVEGIAENILTLAEQTQQIGEIIATVNEIAAQSNILALNASVEAARAGEHGKGFAVVAVEVRNLAEQSRQATAQVRTILSDIQKATNATVMATEEGAKRVEEGVQLAAQAGEAIEQLAGVIEESAQAAAQMVAGGRQQAAGVEQVAVAMQSINQTTVQSLASTRQTERAAQALSELASSLVEIVEQYGTEMA
jgi:methyl-accepting chemotaxis protein